MCKNVNLYSKMLGFLTKKGDKKSAAKILNSSIFHVSKELQLSPGVILLRIFSKLNSFVEVKKVKSRRGTHLVPFFIGYNRRLYLSTKWIMDAINSDSRSISMSSKLSSEIISLLNDRQSKSLSKKKINIKNVLRNRSNVHFRW